MRAPKSRPFKIGADDYLGAPLRPAISDGARRRPSAPRLPLQHAARFGAPGQPVRIARRRRRHTPENALPSGWAECELCGFRAPRPRFEKEDLMGRMKLQCPSCRESDHVIISID